MQETETHPITGKSIYAEQNQCKNLGAQSVFLNCLMHLNFTRCQIISQCSDVYVNTLINDNIPFWMN